MTKVILKFVGGILLGLVLAGLISAGQSTGAGVWILFILWGVGIIGGFTDYLTWLSGALNVSLKLGFLALISFGTGFIGFLMLILVLFFILMIGWVYGWFVLIKELIAAL